MKILIILIVVSLVIALIFLALFIWSVKSNQYEDTDSPSIRILYDDKPREDSLDI
ncbi:cbb3-type cytochrome oxidase assembly protein CcoS [Reichenbachiella carrageenanivorans]|uniref:Cbb3-type cytochrome oxidase assembly protein CcoS n=1 Tax=Reichenbachiella carrageenanivorans TaxID=2979869 RepID=A0ABY6CX46_9BACT|nr:cbb3-type cytochrome oxidase assembly protein CcoS [Reichenbachiella carrageenanivorans]UXX78494.1 cbb3-type cytochrome oxidase assembly protein CcoS [Reichenbachiella carrageenanivorans]